MICSIGGERLRRHDLDAEAGEPDIAVLRRGDEADRRDAEVLEDLRAEPDLAPLALALGLRAAIALFAVLRDCRHRHADRAVAQEDEHALPLALEMLQHLRHRAAAA